MRLANKVALIAGAGGSMGTAVPLLFAQEGAKVVLAARREEPLHDIQRRIQTGGGDAAVVAGDMTVGDDVQRAVQQTVSLYGRLDIFYVNLGDAAGGGKKLADTPEDSWDYLMDINLKGAYLATRYAVPVMQQQGGGVIVFVSANRSVRMRAHAGYSAAKAGLIGLTSNLARSYRENNIRFVCICPPGGMSMPVEGATIAVPPKELVRKGRGEDVAYAALYLCSDEASWVTGISLPIDGGDELAPQT
ncbi:MAG: Glucose 1-dehydrogenase 1 [Nitrospira sp.]|nr:Glucose 1-dehydrogenase 1 [Nitrospira sp.]